MNCPRKIICCTRLVRIRTYGSTARPKPLKLPAHNPTLLPLVQSASNLLISRGPYTDPSVVHRVKTRCGGNDGQLSMEEVVTPLFVSSPSAHSRPIGFLRPNVLTALQSMSSSGFPLQFHRADLDPWAVSFAPWVNEGGFSLRSSHMNELASRLRSMGLFSSPGPLDGAFLPLKSVLESTH